MLFGGARRFGLLLLGVRGRAVLSVVVLSASVAISAVAFAASGGGGWSIQRTPNPKGFDRQLLSVSCSSPRACTAVGFYRKLGHGFVTLAERWNGTKWFIQRPPIPTGAAVGAALYGVYCTSRHACTAVGSYWNKDIYHGKTLAERWNGSKWSIQHTPNPTGSDTGLNGVSCASASACTAVGAHSKRNGALLTLAERWNGTKWSIQHTPNPKSFVLSSVSCSSQRACTAVGFSEDKELTLTERWNGRKWSLQHTPNISGELLGVSCRFNSACTAVGENFGGSSPFAESWNGTKWSSQHTPKPTPEQYGLLNAVSCTFKNNCTAVGNYYTGKGSRTLAEHLNGG